MNNLIKECDIKDPWSVFSKITNIPDLFKLKNTSSKKCREIKKSNYL